MTAEHRILFEAAIAHPPPFPQGRFAGRGIVICAGGARLFTCAYVTIGVLRRVLGCRLPIEVWHLGPREIGPPMRRLLEELDCVVIDALAVARDHPVRTLGGWEMKPYALIHSRFREVLLLDAENLPVVDPAFLFDLPQYAETGALFWPDVVRLRAEASIWDLTGVPYRSEPTFESGQVVVDKQRCWPALQLTLHMNEHSDFYYHHVYGDKDTFYIAWRRLGRPFAMTPHIPGQDQYGLYQRDFDGRILFQHRNSAKWQFDGRNPRIPGFRHEEACFALLAELKGLWNGLVFQPPAATPAARDTAAELEAKAWFDFARIGSGTRRLQLLADNRIGEGRDDDAFYWSVEEDGDGLCLNLHGRRRLLAKLRRCEDGSWTGRSLDPQASALDLAPHRAAGPAATPSEEPEQRPAEAAPLPQAGPLAAALLRRLLAHSPRNVEEARDLTGALRLLAAHLPGFAAAMDAEGALAEGEAGPALACLREVIGERRSDRPTSAEPLPGHGFGRRIDILGKTYDRQP
jgi:hypothetical protein